LRAVLRLTNFFNDAVGAIAGAVFDDVCAAVDAIPLPVPTTFIDLLAYLTCPLTPLALINGDIASLIESDVNSQLKAVQNFNQGIIDRARRSYEDILGSSINAKLIDQIRKYDRQLRQLSFDPVSFAEAVVATAIVQSVCDDDEFDDVFVDFAKLSDGFAFSGLVPTGLSTDAAAVLAKFSQGELKFKALRAALFG